MTPAQMISTVDGAVDEIEADCFNCSVFSAEGRVVGGSGSGGGAVEICTLNITTSVSFRFCKVLY